MSERVQDATKRRIGDKNHNSYVANRPGHRSTRLAPDSFYRTLPPKTREDIKDIQQTLEKRLRKSIGEPAYSAPGFVLYHADSVEVLGKLEDARFEVNLSLTSPPYNIGKEYESLVEVEEYVDWCKTWMTQIHAVTAPTGTFWLNVGHLEVPGKGLCVPIPYLLWDKSPFYLLQEIVWKYGAGVSTKKRLSPRNEKWLFFVKDPSKYTFNLDEIRDPNVKYPNQKKNGKFRCNPLGKNPSDVWDIPKVTTGKNRSSRERTGHPAQFPLRVVERVILASSDLGDVVLDPFAGSCSAGIAASALGRIFVGIEQRADYGDLSASRFEEFKSDLERESQQETLF